MSPALECRACGETFPVEDPSGTVECPECGEDYPLNLPGRASNGPANGPSEKQVERRVIEFYQSFGCCVYKTSEPQHSLGRSKGIPDLIVFAAGCKVAPEPMWYQEVKAPGGRQRPAQQEFQKRCEDAGVPYLLGGVEVAARFLGFEV